jgi:hypothetical protein
MVRAMDTHVPSIRGALLKQSIDWLGSLVVAQRTSPQALGVRLHAEDFALFTHRIEGDAWYPVDSAARIDEALVRAHGGTTARVMLELGARRARSALAGRPGAPERGAADRAEIDPSVLFTLAPPLNFGRWRAWGRSLRRFTLQLDDAEPLPETTRYNLQGYLERTVGELLSELVEVTSERPRPDQVVFRVHSIH